MYKELKSSMLVTVSYSLRKFLYRKIQREADLASRCIPHSRVRRGNRSVLFPQSGERRTIDTL